jgi:hypothetical protein
LRRADRRPDLKESPLLELLARARSSYNAQSRARRELIIFGVALAIGLFLVPLLIWVAGNRVLGPYTRGQETHAGPFALLADFFVGLAHGSIVFWAVALGPAVFLLLIRALVAAARRRPDTAPPSR